MRNLLILKKILLMKFLIFGLICLLSIKLMISSLINYVEGFDNINFIGVMMGL